MPREKLKRAVFWVAVGTLVGLRLHLSADLSVQINYSPHDDSLYIERALRLLQGEGFGPYDSVILVKYPGLSLWLAGMRSLGVPFLFSVNALYIGAGLYLAVALLRCGSARWAMLAALAFYVLNPIAFSYEWVRVIREPLATGLLVLIVGAMAHIFAGIERGRMPWLHAGVLAPAFAFALFVREDDRLLWALMALFAAFLLWPIVQRRSASREWLVLIACAVLVPAATAKAYEYILRGFVERHYGLPIVHELGEGEYPRLLAAMRAINSAKDNRMVMVTQETLQKLRSEVPLFRPVVDRLPPPGPGTLSCKLHGVCSEWSNGWMPFWIKDEAFRAGLTPTLAEAQSYFRRVREAIERACDAGRFRCTDRGSGLVPAMELRWIRAYVVETVRLARMTLWPELNLVGAPPLVYDVPVELGRKFQAVTMTDYFDTQRQTSFLDGPHRRIYESSASSWRERIAKPYQWLAAGVLFAGLMALVLRLWFSGSVPPSALFSIAAVFGIYSVVRLAALAYVAVYMGAFDSRMVFSSYALGTFLAFVLLADSMVSARPQSWRGQKHA